MDGSISSFNLVHSARISWEYLSPISLDIWASPSKIRLEVSVFPPQPNIVAISGDARGVAQACWKCCLFLIRMSSSISEGSTTVLNMVSGCFGSSSFFSGTLTMLIPPDALGRLLGILLHISFVASIFLIDLAIESGSLSGLASCLARILFS